MNTKRKATINNAIVKRALIDAFKKLDPRIMAKNPVMFVVEVGFVITLILTLFPTLFGGEANPIYNGSVSIILLLTRRFFNICTSPLLYYLFLYKVYDNKQRINQLNTNKRNNNPTNSKNHEVTIQKLRRTHWHIFNTLHCQGNKQWDNNRVKDEC